MPIGQQATDFVVKPAAGNTEFSALTALADGRFTALPDRG
jgi:hypothetical protein